MAGSDPLLTTIVLGATAILIIGLIFNLFKQPTMIGYIIAGILIGPSMFGIFTNIELITIIGNIGVVLLLFFLGMEVSLPKLLARWRVAIFGTLGQIALSLGVSFLLGNWLDWPIGRIMLIGFVIALSSTAVLIKLLEAKGYMDKKRGQDIISILLVQDLAIVPMIIFINTAGGSAPTTQSIVLQIVGAALLVTAMILVYTHKGVLRLPFAKKLKKDHDLQVFGAFILCFGLAAITGAIGLSAALGAFMAGMLISKLEGTDWVHDALHSFKIVFVAAFFVSIGLLIDLDFFWEHRMIVLLLAGIILVLNTFINAVILRSLGETWGESFYSGSLLAQIGEFSFVLAATGLSVGLIEDFGYQIVIMVIATTLIVSPAWTTLFKKITKVD